MLIWISFWITYLIIGYLLCDVFTSQCKILITTQKLVKTIGLNILMTFIISLIIENKQGLFLLPKTLYGYIIHILCSVIVGELCSYTSHRLLHHPFFYQYHKIHHSYIIPHTLVGVYSHPIEMALNIYQF